MKGQSFLFVFTLMLFAACNRDGSKNSNRLPDTRIVVDSINLTGDLRLRSTVFLSWWGSDQDGYITGFDVSVDNGATWTYTTEYDSTFQFDLAAGSDSADIELLVRAIDNLQATDPSPAYLKVPIKNTPPIVAIDEEAQPEDSSRVVVTYRWSATDPDGDETLTNAYVRINDGDWTEIGLSSTLVTFVPQTPQSTGLVTSDVYFNTESTSSKVISGLRLNDTNTVYFKVIDEAGAESEPDTSKLVFIKNQTSDLLVISGQGDLETSTYQQALNPIYGAYDLEDYARDGNRYQPKFWNPTFDRLAELYDKIFFFSDESIFTNPVTNRKDLLLEMAAPHIQKFSNDGGKSLITTSFAKGQNIEAIVSTLPIDSLSSAVGQAFITPDSSIVAQEAGFPDLSPTLLILGTDPFYHSVDSDPLYTAQLSIQAPWTGPNVVGAQRSNSGKMYQVFFSVQLLEFDTNPADLTNLLDQILNNEFNP